MSKSRKAKTVTVRKPRDPQRRNAVQRFFTHFFFACVFAGLLAFAGYAARDYVTRTVAFPPTPPKVVLLNRPAWMSDLLAEQIVRAAKPLGAHSAFDHQLLVDIDRILRASPWIREVRQVRRAYESSPGDTVEIDCDYRAPVALVQWKDTFWLVDGDGYKLPAEFTGAQLPQVMLGADHKMNIRLITNVLYPPAPTGKKWPGNDLVAGLDLVKLLYAQPWAEEVNTVDVRNYSSRVDANDAQLALGTRHGTTIKWGRPINGGNDFFVEIPVQRKIDVLKRIITQYGRIDAGQPWVDIRLDQPVYPSPEAPVANGQ
ncbi:MAG TPA: hypothetical protein VHS31_08395 [Tepidisphaeraceae bacterium]|jgi:hypothetical protein|nr:hypothetical protein [Tepidisphaeraceae bacterium]